MKAELISKILYNAGKYLAGFILILGGILKIINSEIIFPWYFNSRFPFILIPVAEVSFGVWLLSGKQEEKARLLAKLVFLLFVVVNLILYFSGSEKCNCLGSLSPTPLYTLMLDLAIFSLLQFSGKQVFFKEISALSTFFIRFKFPIIGFVFLVFLWLFENDRKIRGVFFYALNRPIICELPTVFLGVCKSGDQVDGSILVTNGSPGAVRIVGFKSTCSLVAMNLPLEIPQNLSRAIPIKLKTPEASGYYTFRVFFFTDYPGESILPIDCTLEIIK